MTRKTIEFPTPPGGRERLIGRMLEAEGVKCLNDLREPGPYVVGQYDFETALPRFANQTAGWQGGVGRSQFSPWPEADPPEDSWEDFAINGEVVHPDKDVKARHWRLWCDPSEGESA